jgi:predicted PhzF superfamily epimerase YddE/YHI9
MEIPKDKVLDLLREQGKDDQVDQAQQELPDQVDPEQHADLLQKFGLDPQDLIGKLGGGVPGL